MRTYFATTEELRQLNRNRWESAALLLLNGFSVGTSFPLLFTGQYFRGGLYALLALFSAIIWWRVRQRDGVLKQHIRERGWRS